MSVANPISLAWYAIALFSSLLKTQKALSQEEPSDTLR